jgi:predicted N-formylglutamate amidohydrolase
LNLPQAAINSVRLLGDGDPEPVGVRNGAAASDFFLTCEHAGNAVPKALGDLGLDRGELDRHIAFDIGILGVCETASDLLDAPLIFQRYSRLVADCNRRPTSGALIVEASDGTIIPANRALSDTARQDRIAAIVTPFQGEIARRLDLRRERGLPTLLVSLHSFTPALRADPVERPWQVGLCIGADERFSAHVANALAHERPGLIVGRNAPYGIDMREEYTIPVHGEGRGLPYVQFEIRQDLIETPDGQADWGERIARVLQAARAAFFA